MPQGDNWFHISILDKQMHAQNVLYIVVSGYTSSNEYIQKHDKSN